MMSNYTSAVSKLVTSAMYRVYGWMSAGIGLTGLISYGVASNPALRSALLGNIFVTLALVIAQFGLLFFFMRSYSRLTYGEAVGSFLGYSALSGLTLSAIFLIYSFQSIIAVLFVTAGMFACVTVYGLVTRHDLSPMGSFLMMSLFGIILFRIINTFIGSAQFDGFISFIGVIVFALFTAYDAQRLRDMLAQMVAYPKEQKKAAVVGALVMYMNFLNLFLNLLRLLGKRRD